VIGSETLIMDLRWASVSLRDPIQRFPRPLLSFTRNDCRLHSLDRSRNNIRTENQHEYGRGCLPLRDIVPSLKRNLDRSDELSRFILWSVALSPGDRMMGKTTSSLFAHPFLTKTETGPEWRYWMANINFLNN
jgi:hypothetical protein